MDLSRITPIKTERLKKAKGYPAASDYNGETKEETEKTSNSLNSRNLTLFNPCTSPTPVRKDDQYKVQQKSLTDFSGNSGLIDELLSDIIRPESLYGMPDYESQEYSFLGEDKESKAKITLNERKVLKQSPARKGASIQHLPSSSISSSTPSFHCKQEQLKFNHSKSGSSNFKSARLINWEGKNESIENPNEPSMEPRAKLSQSSLTDDTKILRNKLKLICFFFEHYSDASELLNVCRIIDSVNENAKKLEVALANLRKFESESEEESVFGKAEGERRCLEFNKTLEEILESEESSNRILSSKFSSLQNYKVFMKKFGIDQIVDKASRGPKGRNSRAELDSLIPQLPKMIEDFGSLHNIDDISFKNEIEKPKRTHRVKSCHIQTSDYYSAFSESNASRSIDFREKIDLLDKYSQKFILAFSQESASVLGNLTEQLLKIRSCLAWTRDTIKVLRFCIKDIRQMRRSGEDLASAEAAYEKLFSCEDSKEFMKLDLMTLRHIENSCQKLFEEASARKGSLKGLQSFADLGFFQNQRRKVLKNYLRRNEALLRRLAVKAVETQEGRKAVQLEAQREKIKTLLTEIKLSLGSASFSEPRMKALIASLSKAMSEAEIHLAEAENDSPLLIDIHPVSSMISIRKSVEMYLFIGYKFLAVMRLIVVICRRGLIKPEYVEGCRAFLELSQQSVYAGDLHLNNHINIDFLADFKAKYTKLLGECHSAFASLDEPLKGIAEWDKLLEMFISCRKRGELVQQIYDLAKMERSFSEKVLCSIFESLRLFDAGKSEKMLNETIAKLGSAVLDMKSLRKIPIVENVAQALTSRSEILALVLQNKQSLEEMIRMEKKVADVREKASSLHKILENNADRNSMRLVEFYESKMLEQLSKLGHVIVPIEDNIRSIKSMIDEVDNRFELFKCEKLNFDRVVSSLSRLESLKATYEEKVSFLESLAAKHFSKEETRVATRNIILARQNFMRILQSMIIIVKEINYLKYEFKEVVLTCRFEEDNARLDAIVENLMLREENFSKASAQFDLQGNMLPILRSYVNIFCAIKEDIVTKKQIQEFLLKSGLRVSLFDKQWKLKFKDFLEQGLRLREKKYSVFEHLESLQELTGLKYLETLSAKFLEFMSRDYKQLDLPLLLNIHDAIIYLRKEDLESAISLIQSVKECVRKAKDFFSRSQPHHETENKRLLELNGSSYNEGACINFLKDQMNAIHLTLLNFNIRLANAQSSVALHAKLKLSLFRGIEDLSEAKNLIEKNNLQKWMQVFDAILQFFDQPKFKESRLDKRQFFDNLLQESMVKLNDDLNDRTIDNETFQFFVDFSQLYSNYLNSS